MGGQFQFDDPTQPNHVQVTATSGQLLGGWSLRDAYHGGEPAPAQALTFKVAETLPSGTLLRLSLTQVTLPHYVVDQLELLLEVDGGEGRPLSRAPIIIASQPGPFSEVFINAPPAVTLGEPWSLLVRAEDAFGNLSAPDFPRTFDLYMNGVFERRLTLSEAITQVDGLTLEVPGVHRAELVPAAGGIRHAGGPILAMAREAPIVEWLSLREPVEPPHGPRSLELARQEAAGRFQHFLPTSEPQPGWLNIGRGLEVQESRPSVLSGGSRFSIRGPGEEVDLLLAEVPTDLRGLPTRIPKLAEIAAARSIYDWHGVKAADQGYAPAFAASVHSHGYSGLDWSTATAVVRRPKETLMSALARGGSYVAYGERILLLVSAEAELLAADAMPGLAPLPTAVPGTGRLMIAEPPQGPAAEEPAEAATAEIAQPVVKESRRERRRREREERRAREREEAERQAAAEALAAASEAENTGLATEVGQGSLDALAAASAEQAAAEPSPPRRAIRLSAEIVGETGITQLELFKNGQLLQTFSFAQPDPEWLALSFHSGSRPLGAVQSLPRNAREWLGYIAANEGVLSTERVQPNVSVSADRRRIDFLLHSHGGAAGFRFRLRPQFDDSALTLALAPGMEDAAWLPKERLPAQSEPQRIELPLALLQAGPVSHPLSSVGYEDSVELRRARPAASNYAALAYVDEGPAQPGDYYFFRAHTAGGGIAWSSPLYVEPAP